MRLMPRRMKLLLNYVISTSKPPIILQPKLEKNLNSSMVIFATVSSLNVNCVAYYNVAPAIRMGISQQGYPLVSLKPYHGDWTIKVRVIDKVPLCSFKNARGECNVSSVELSNEDSTQI
ncbi:hypothetical protein GOP47_0030619 [Adiantum capillus-veneris]|nr:hypothetical protein GOP47_0030619 [Adiantum capillus-veneris]